MSRRCHGVHPTFRYFRFANIRWWSTRKRVEIHFTRKAKNYTVYPDRTGLNFNYNGDCRRNNEDVRLKYSHYNVSKTCLACTDLPELPYSLYGFFNWKSTSRWFSLSRSSTFLFKKILDRDGSVLFFLLEITMLLRCTTVGLNAFKSRNVVSTRPCFIIVLRVFLFNRATITSRCVIWIFLSFIGRCILSLPRSAQTAKTS